MDDGWMESNMAARDDIAADASDVDERRTRRQTNKE